MQRLYGRDGVIESTIARVAEAGAGSGRALLFTGEPGIGKSRMAEHLAAEAAARGARVAWGRSWEAGGAPAYGPGFRSSASSGWTPTRSPARHRSSRRTRRRFVLPRSIPEDFHAAVRPGGARAGGVPGRLPQLRGIAHTAPFYHDNSHETLTEVIDSYSRFLLSSITPLELPRVHPPEAAGSPPESLSVDQKRDLLAFLRRR